MVDQTIIFIHLVFGSLLKENVVSVPLQLTVTAIGLVPSGTDKSFGVR